MAFSPTPFYESRLQLGGFLFGQSQTASIAGGSVTTTEDVTTTAPRTTIRGDRLILSGQLDGSSSEPASLVVRAVTINDVEICYRLSGASGYGLCGTYRLFDSRSKINPSIGAVIRQQDTVAVTFQNSNSASSNTAMKGWAAWRAATASATTGIESSTPSAGATTGTGRAILVGANSGSSSDVTFEGKVNAAHDLTVHHLTIDVGADTYSSSAAEVKVLRWQDDDFVTPGTDAGVYYDVFDWESPSFSFLGRRIDSSQQLTLTIEGSASKVVSASISARLA